MADVTIIGGGPGGSIAAVVLARRGHRVTVLEQHRFPRDKVCGECLSALGIGVLRSLDLIAPVEALRPARMRRAVLLSPSGRCAAISLPAEMWGLTRKALDEILLTAAGQAGADVRQRQRCESLCCDNGGRPVLGVRDLSTNRTYQLRCDYVILADGKGALGLERPPASGDLGIKAHFRDVGAPADAVVLFGLPGHYGGVGPTEGGLWNLAMSVPEWRLRQARGDPERLLGAMVDENRGLAAMIRGARQVSDWLAAPLPRYGLSRQWPERVIPIGNAASAIEPIGGEGMGLAMASGAIAAGVIDAAERAGRPVNAQALRRAYGRLWSTRGPACRAAAKIVSWPMVAEAALPLVAATGVPDALLYLVGKG
jgi:flavin-dependent dehydrogenase